MPSYKGYSRPRPIRVAFLVEEHEHWGAMLDAIFDEAYARWGGRFCLIVPCENGNVRAAYLPWLIAYDPDIIYSYVELDERVFAQLHERIYPAFLIKHRFYREDRDHRAFRPGLPLTPLTGLSAACALSRADAIPPSQTIALIDAHPGSSPSRLLQENFGCCYQSLGRWPATGNSEHLRTITFVPEEIQVNPRLVPRAEGEIVPTEIALLERIASQRNLFGLAQLSACLAPRCQIRNGKWSQTVNLIIGDSFADRIVFWNARHYLPVWLHNDIVTLKLSPRDLEDAAIFQAIIKIIKNRIHVSSGNASYSRITVRSASLSQAELEVVAARFKAGDRFNAYEWERIDSIDACAPTHSVLTKHSPYADPGAPFGSRDWHEFSFSEDGFRPPNVFPRHIGDAIMVPSTAKQGFWALDLDIERSVDYSRFENVQHHWRLPRRLRMTSAFTRGYTLGNNGPFCMPRVTRGGFLGLFSTADGQLPEIRMPDDKSVFSFAICGSRDWLPFSGDPEPPPPGIAVDFRASDKGRYLTALLDLADGIHGANGIFLGKFWKDQFEMLGATPAATEERIHLVAQTLKKRLRSGQITCEEDWNRIAKVVLSEARNIRSDPRYLTFEVLARHFEAYRNTYWATHEAGAPRSEWEEDEKQSLARSVQYLCQRKILYQGHEWRCRKCYNNNWVGIDELKRSMVCDVCGAAQPAPVAEAWHFKLNGFVLEGMRQHGLLASLWCLAKLAQKTNDSFFYMEPHELFFSEASLDQRSPDAELDLLVVSDGTVRLCEAKTSSRDIDIRKLADLALRLRPDIVTLAVMEPASRELQQRLADLQGLLKGSEISCELMTLENHDIEDDPMLPAGRSVRVRL